MDRKNRWEKQQQLLIQKHLKELEAIYSEAAEEASIIGAGIRNVKEDKPFTFDDYPSTKKRINAMMQKMKKSMMVVLINGIRSSWTLANNKNNELCNQVFGDNADDIPDALRDRYYSTNPAAQDAFINRKENGLGLSDRVWNYTNQYKEEIEYDIGEGIREGKSAEEMSRELKDKLKHPNKIFRRRRGENGELQESKPSKEFHPGKGVYKSSHKNARRLAATECNMAYRTADYERWQQMDFVVGIKIETEGTRDTVVKEGGKVIKEGGNPTVKRKGIRISDICDELAGKYPKDFKFVGWHPHCRCHALTILKSLEEMEADNKRIMNGEEPIASSENEVKDVPKAYKDWLENNADRIEKAKSLPYFMKDNPKYLGHDEKTGFKGAKYVGKNNSKVNKEDEKDKLNITNLEDLIEKAKEMNIEFIPPRKLKNELSTEDIIAKIGSEDNVGGACASQCLAYIANKKGYDVKDMKSIASSELFGNDDAWEVICKKCGGIYKMPKNEIKCANEFIKNMKEGREYVMGVGEHTSIVKKIDGVAYYLDSQSKKNSGYKILEKEELSEIFTCSEKNKNNKAYLLCVDSLKVDDELETIFGFINTNRYKSKK